MDTLRQIVLCGVEQAALGVVAQVAAGEATQHAWIGGCDAEHVAEGDGDQRAKAAAERAAPAHVAAIGAKEIGKAGQECPGAVEELVAQLRKAVTVEPGPEQIVAAEDP